MKRLMVFLLVPAAVLMASGKELRQADLTRLIDPASRLAEVERLVGCAGKDWSVRDLHLVRAAPSGDSGGLLVLSYDYDFGSISRFGSAYAIEDPDGLFQTDQPAAGGLAPVLTRISDQTLVIFGSDGRELQPFGSSCSLNGGYLFDMNQDGLLDLADSASEEIGVKGLGAVDVFSLKTVEPQPRTMLRVIFNWHSPAADEHDRWGFTCFDEDGDGRVEIGFGPKLAVSVEDERRFVFRWNEETGSYSAGEIPDNAHIRVMRKDETLADVAKNGGLRYEESGGDPDDPFSPAGRPQAPAAPRQSYVFESLKGSTDSELLAFFQGKQHRTPFFSGADALETNLPDACWAMPPKQAALAFADANRTPAHRHRWKLVIDDRDGVAPPFSGWIHHVWGSSGCYSYSEHVFALRFGVPEPFLLATDYNSNGVVGRNPLADQPGHGARLVPLSAKEARFLADTLFWMDRIRSHAPDGDDRPDHHGSSTADGFGTLHLLADGGKPREMASDTVWATRSVSSHWEKEYSPLIFLNLTEHLLADALPRHLAGRWDIAPEIDRRSLATPLAERLKPRNDGTARLILEDTIREVLARHSKDPIPAPVVAKLVEAAGEEALTRLRPELDRLRASIPPRGAEDDEFDALEKRFTYDHFGNATRDDPSDHPVDHARYRDLEMKREFEAPAVLRSPVADALEKLRLAGSTKLLLKQASAAEGPARWALDRLRKQAPEVWADHLIAEFQDANLDAQRNLFSTLAAARPEAARTLMSLMSPVETGDLLIEVSEFQIEHDPASAARRVPALIDIVRQRDDDYIRRGQAMNLLGRIQLDAGAVDELTPLLLAEIKDPQNGTFAGTHTFSEALDALSRLPGADAHLDEISTATAGGFNGFSSGIESLLRLLGDRPDRNERLVSFIRPRLKKHNGMMNRVFVTALALDLRELAPDIASMATSAPGVRDGDGADYAGGRFKGPDGEKYHIAREITAMWSEPDAATRARMWIAFVSAHPSYFDSGDCDSGLTSALRDRASALIRELPVDQRDACIDAAIAGSPSIRYYTGTTRWMAALASDDRKVSE